MIVKLKGTIDYILGDQLALNINNVVYGVTATNQVLRKNPSETITLYITSITKEDGTTLFGFETLTEKLWFNELIKLNGISGRIAINILSSTSVSNLELALLTKDELLFSAIPGIGKKLATRIITEMTNAPSRISNIMLQYIGTDSNAVNTHPTNETMTNNQKSNKNILEAMEALQAIGFNRTDCYPAIQHIVNEQPDITVSDLVKSTLQKLKQNQ